MFRRPQAKGRSCHLILKKNVCTIALKEEKEVWGHTLCYCSLFIPLLCSLQQHVKSGYWAETKRGQMWEKLCRFLTVYTLPVRFFFFFFFWSFLFVDHPANRRDSLCSLKCTWKVQAVFGKVAEVKQQADRCQSDVNSACARPSLHLSRRRLVQLSGADYKPSPPKKGTSTLRRFRVSVLLMPKDTCFKSN